MTLSLFVRNLPRSHTVGCQTYKPTCAGLEPAYPFGMSDFESDAVPIEPTRHIIAGATGLEPVPMVLETIMLPITPYA